MTAYGRVMTLDEDGRLDSTHTTDRPGCGRTCADLVSQGDDGDGDDEGGNAEGGDGPTAGSG
jgi:hypothetical protein